MSYYQNYQDHSPLTDKEIQEVVSHSQRSIHKTITLPNGKRQYILSTKAMLDKNGKPIPIDEFMILSGQRKFVEPIERAKLSEEEKLQIWANKKEWKKNNPNHICVRTHSLKNLKLAIDMSNAANRN